VHRGRHRHRDSDRANLTRLARPKHGAVACRAVQVLIALVIGLVIWLVLWSLGAKADDAFLPLILLILGGAVARLMTPYINEKLKP